MASPGITELATHTFEDLIDSIADNLGNHIPLIGYLERKGNVQTTVGGEYIRHPLAYQENGTYTRYSGWEEINISSTSTISAARFNHKQVAVSISISGKEDLQVSGEPELLDLLESRSMVAEKTYQNNMELDLVSDGTADGGRQVNGLQSLVADSPGSATVGGINDGTWAFWQNYSFDATTDGGAPVSSANIEEYMLQVWTNTMRNGDMPDLIYSSGNYWNAYHNALAPMQRIAKEVTAGGKAGSGFKVLDYMGADVVNGGGRGGACPTNHMYFLNLDYLKLRPHSRRNFTKIGADRYSLNQDGTVRLIGWMGNLTCGNRFLQGVLKD